MLKRDDPEYTKAWNKAYRERNKEKIRAYRESRKETMKAWRESHKEYLKDYGKAYHETHREEQKTYNKAYRVTHRDRLREQDHADYLQNREQRLAEAKHYRMLAKMQAFEAYGGAVCACCGETHVEFLAIDHASSNGSEHRREIGNLTGYRMAMWLKKHGYPPGFRILCANCNSSLGYFGYCPHGTLQKTHENTQQ